MTQRECDDECTVVLIEAIAARDRLDMNELFTLIRRSGWNELAWKGRDTDRKELNAWEALALHERELREIKGPKRHRVVVISENGQLRDITFAEPRFILVAEAMRRRNRKDIPITWPDPADLA